jgi:hypothetical protein
VREYVGFHGLSSSLLRWSARLLAVLGILTALQGRAAADDAVHEKTFRPFLAKHCLECHGEKAAKRRL